MDTDGVDSDDGCDCVDIGFGFSIGVGFDVEGVGNNDDCVGVDMDCSCIWNGSDLDSLFSLFFSSSNWNMYYSVSHSINHFCSMLRENEIRKVKVNFIIFHSQPNLPFQPHWQ